MNRSLLINIAALFALVLAALKPAPALAEDAGEASPQQSPWSLVVMDPLARPLSCACVEGYAQRDYEKLAEYLESKTGHPVRIAFAESLDTALAGNAKGRVDVIIGKDSVVRADCREANIKIVRLAALSDKDGETTQTGLIVVARDDPAISVAAPVMFVDAMARDTGDTFADNRWSVQHACRSSK